MVLCRSEEESSGVTEEECVVREDKRLSSVSSSSSSSSSSPHREGRGGDHTIAGSLLETASSKASVKGPINVEEHDHNKNHEEPFVSRIGPLMERFQENLQHEFAYINKLQSLCLFLQEENKCLKEEVHNLKGFVFSAKSNQSKNLREEISSLSNKVQALQVALRIEILKSDEFKKELDDAKHVLARRTRAILKKGQLFEVVIAQKPQEATLASCATPLCDEDMRTCPICLEEFDVASGWYTLNCKHSYHLVCLVQVMPTRARCCICNQELHKLLYEVFGMANRYPNDARLWDAQTGQPVDFTLEEDIRAVINEIEESQESEEEVDEEATNTHNDGQEEILLLGEISGEENRDENWQDLQDSDIEDMEELNLSQEEGEVEEEEGEEEEEDEDEQEEEEGTSDDDREVDEEDFNELESYITGSEGEDPNDPDYTPSQ